jgi:hypothetical protein
VRPRKRGQCVSVTVPGRPVTRTITPEQVETYLRQTGWREVNDEYTPSPRATVISTTRSQATTSRELAGLRRGLRDGKRLRLGRLTRRLGERRDHELLQAPPAPSDGSGTSGFVVGVGVTPL